MRCDLPMKCFHLPISIVDRKRTKTKIKRRCFEGLWREWIERHMVVRLRIPVRIKETLFLSTNISMKQSGVNYRD